MQYDFDNLVAVEVAEYDPQQARRALEATVALVLDAQRQRELRTRREREEGQEDVARPA